MGTHQPLTSKAKFISTSERNKHKKWGSEIMKNEFNKRWETQVRMWETQVLTFKVQLLISNFQLSNSQNKWEHNNLHNQSYHS
jgi:uncharacterized protein (DUF2147 family)